MAEPQEKPVDETTAAPNEQGDPTPDLDAIHAAFEVERAEMRDRLMRSLADLENIRKRAEKDRREAAIYGGQKLARDMLSVYDNLNRALALMDDSLREQQKGLAEGLDLTLRDLGNIFQRHGIELVAPQIGDQFDPHFHEAMFEAPVPGTKAGQIIQVISEGFRLHEHLLRPAQVGVSSTPG
ncbi:nucleotide exchange factor GrpE [Pararhodobacter sp.]|uniref:nucleotide exchange factor GrpE n=1 Tax=Pararhodobacter sp. TaxID=2127056 RepID=UPI002AFE35E7|nr:nucleotide exchange factor GrpE [Pararhodobacter sp.]